MLPERKKQRAYRRSKTSLRKRTVRHERSWPAWKKRLVSPGVIAMLGTFVPNFVTDITQYEQYEFWLECSCGYEANSVLATFCGGCGHNINLPEHVASALEKDRIESAYLRSGQWYAQVWQNSVRHEVALRPELNGKYTT